jgi:hypothetical protein
VRAANASAEEKPDKGTEPEREAVDVKATLPRLEAEPKPASAEAEPEAKPKRKRREPGQPRPKRQWWEENARWRLREPQDDDRPRRPLNQCIHEYDPLTYDEEG